MRLGNSHHHAEPEVKSKSCTELVLVAEPGSWMTPVEPVYPGDWMKPAKEMGPGSWVRALEDEGLQMGPEHSDSRTGPVGKVWNSGWGLGRKMDAQTTGR